MRRAGTVHWVRVVGLAVLVVALVVTDARSTVVEETREDCANCEKSFRAVEVRSSNTYGGIDADGCRNANGDPPMAYLIQVCTHCLTARYPALQEEAPEGERAAEFLRQAAKSRSFKEDVAQSEIPNATKYELACGLLEAENRNPYYRATLWQRAAWTARGEARAALLHPEEDWDDDVPGAWRELDSEAWDTSLVLDRHAGGARTDTGREVVSAHAVAAAAASDPVDAALRRLYLAVVLRCHGELVAAAAELEAVTPGEPPAAMDEDEKVLRAWIEATRLATARGLDTERTFLQRSLDAAAEVAAEPPADAAFVLVWRWSECHRRLGNDAQAAKSLEHMLANDDMDDALLVLLRDTAEWAGNGTPKWRDAVLAAWNSRIEALVTAIRDSEGGEEGEDAANRLAQIGDPDALESLVALLPVDEAGAAAALALEGYAPPQKVVAQLEKLVSDPEGDLELRWRAIDTLVAWAEPTSAAVFRAVLAEEDDFLLDRAMHGLGLTGAQADVPTILARAEEEPESAVWALSLLVARPFDTLDGFRAWWPKHGADGRLAEGVLREAGVEFETFDKAAVPALIALLEDSRMLVRWNAHRALQAIASERLGARELLYEGRFANPKPPDEELDLELVLGDGWTVSYRGIPVFDMDDMGPALQPLRDRDGRTVWRRAKARWQRWWKK